MKVSVVIPAYNAAETLGACLASVQAAAVPQMELWVVDDGSTDATAHVAREKGAQLLQHPQNRGTSAARNTGWRASSGDVIIFVDADVHVRPDTLLRLLKLMQENPNLLGCNGIFAIDTPQPDRVSAFVNTAIHYQHRRHGRRVASAFTAICALRREALLQMGGWDERFFSRYADDVATRWQLPPGSLGMDPEATVVHQKVVRLGGLLRHRANIGYHFLRSVELNKDKASQSPDKILLNLRYPANTALAALTVLEVVFPPAWPLLPLNALGFVGANAGFMWFVLRNRSPGEAIMALPLSVLEGFAYAAGMGRAILHRARS